MKAAFVYSETMTQYDMGWDHPLRPARLRLTHELVSAYNLLDSESRLVSPEPATREDILTAHEAAYVDAVKELSQQALAPNGWRFGFGSSDNRPFPHMYEASLLYTGASLTAAELVMTSRAVRALNISGGLHHAKPAEASGFCIFNDPVVAILRLTRVYDRIAYVDIDVHHGDGVQEAFYDTAGVLTISIHESGDYLFPGTGYVHEIGRGEGRGYSVNIPLSPFTPDEVYVWAFREVVEPLISAYDPQIIVAQLGVDSHFQDPLGHLYLTSHGFAEVVRTIIEFEKPLVGLGGGGYNLSVVPRLWTQAYAEMVETELPDQIPDAFARAHGIHRLHDPTKPRLSSSQQQSTRRSAEQAVRALKELVFPIHGLSSD